MAGNASCFHREIPLIGQVRLDYGVAPLAVPNAMFVVFDLGMTPSSSNSATALLSLTAKRSFAMKSAPVRIG